MALEVDHGGPDQVLLTANRPSRRLSVACDEVVGPQVDARVAAGRIAGIQREQDIPRSVEVQRDESVGVAGVGEDGANMSAQTDGGAGRWESEHEGATTCGEVVHDGVLSVGDEIDVGGEADADGGPALA